MLDGSEHRFRAINADLVSWDRARAKAGWPGPGDAPFLWMTYLAWHHLTKTAGLIPACTLAEFEKATEAVISADALDDDEQGDEPGVDPTRTDRELE